MRRARCSSFPPTSAATWRAASIPVQIITDASDANTAKLVSGDATQIATAYNQQMSTAPAAPVQAAMRLWFNPGLSSKKFYGPGVFVLAISMFPPLLAGLAMAKEGEQKTILQVYVSSISAHEFLLGKILPSWPSRSARPWSWPRCCSPTSASPSPETPRRCWLPPSSTPSA